MLPKQIEAIVIAVRRSDDDVCVEFRRLRIGQEHAGMVVELDEYHRALNPIVERVLVTKPTDPAEIRRIEHSFDRVHSRGERAAGQDLEIGRDQSQESFALPGRKWTTRPTTNVKPYWPGAAC